MKRLTLALILVSLLMSPAVAGIEDEIAAIDRVMVRTCEVAELDYATARKDAIDTFLRYLALLEKQYQGAGNADGVLACRKARAKYDPQAERIDQPTKLHDQLVTFESHLSKQLQKLDRQRAEKIGAAVNLRRQKLTALLRGLVQRDDNEGVALVTDALKRNPSFKSAGDAGADAPAAPSATDPRATPAKDVSHLTYIRATKRWEKMEGGRVESTVADGVNTVHYAQGDHALLKVLWREVLGPGDRFTVEVRGAPSVELVDLEGADANARIGIPPSDKFVSVEITRESDQIIFKVDGKVIKTYYASGSLRGDEARAALVAAALRPAFTVKREEKASFRAAGIIRR